MKIFANKNIWKKIVIIFTIITSISILTPKHVNAADDEGSGVGGALMKPICNLLVGLGDGATYIINDVLVKQERPIIRVDTAKDGWKVFWSVVAGLAVAAAAIALIIVTAGAASAISVALTGTALASISAGTVLILSGALGFSMGSYIYNLDSWGSDIVLPVYSVTVENILTNKIPLFDVNFINPSDEVVTYNEYKGISSGWFFTYNGTKYGIRSVMENDESIDLSDDAKSSVLIEQKNNGKWEKVTETEIANLKNRRNQLEKNCRVN